MCVEGKFSDFDPPFQGYWRSVTSLLIEKGRLLEHWSDMIGDVDTRKHIHMCIEKLDALISKLQMYAQLMIFSTTYRRSLTDLQLTLMVSKKWVKTLREREEEMRTEELKVALKLSLDFLGRNIGKVVEAILDAKLQSFV